MPSIKVAGLAALVGPTYMYPDGKSRDFAPTVAVLDERRPFDPTPFYQFDVEDGAEVLCLVTASGELRLGGGFVPFFRRLDEAFTRIANRSLTARVDKLLPRGWWYGLTPDEQGETYGLVVFTDTDLSHHVTLFPSREEGRRVVRENIPWARPEQLATFLQALDRSLLPESTETHAIKLDPLLARWIIEFDCLARSYPTPSSDAP